MPWSHNNPEEHTTETRSEQLERERLASARRLAGDDQPATWMHSTTTVEYTSIFLPLEPAALKLGVPRAWLKREADAGRVPILSVGRRRLFNPCAVAKALLDRNGAAESPTVGEKFFHNY